MYFYMYFYFYIYMYFYFYIYMYFYIYFLAPRTAAFFLATNTLLSRSAT